jgi:RNA polymerase sigma-70 factor (ECF subfamily)
MTTETVPRDADLEDRELIRLARAGDRAAFNKLFDRALPRVRTLATFGPDRSGSFFGWLREVARHRLLALADRELGRAKRDPRREARILENSTALSLLPPATVTSPTGAVMRNEQLELLHRALARLSDEHRSVILLRCVEGRSTAEAAAALGRNENATAVLLFRALAKLREAYEAEEGT